MNTHLHGRVRMHDPIGRRTARSAECECTEVLLLRCAVVALLLALVAVSAALHAVSTAQWQASP